jgi:hypothetical protein
MVMKGKVFSHKDTPRPLCYRADWDTDMESTMLEDRGHTLDNIPGNDSDAGQGPRVDRPLPLKIQGQAIESKRWAMRCPMTGTMTMMGGDTCPATHGSRPAGCQAAPPTGGPCTACCRRLLTSARWTTKSGM